MNGAARFAHRLEQAIEGILFASRWLLVPFYLGLALILIALGLGFAVEAWHLFARVFNDGESALILGALSLIDIVLVGNLIVMVILSGYENFVSTIEAAHKGDSPAWMGKVDAGTLKLKVAASIVAISSIHLLKAFMNIEDVGNDKLVLMMAIHMVFVVSALLLGWLDKIAFAAHRDH
ncbi:MAG: TIGR00645 family protein [Rhodospirillales bacterium]|nr:TIGR00645 family protein [Rhodospirillales bacterium]